MQPYYFPDYSVRNVFLQKTTRDLVIEDCRGNTISGMTLFTLMFTHLKSAFVKQLEETTKGVPDDWIRWVITVPAIWDDSAKQFIREAAEKVVTCGTSITLV